MKIDRAKTLLRRWCDQLVLHVSNPKRAEPRQGDKLKAQLWAICTLVDYTAELERDRHQWRDLALRFYLSCSCNKETKHANCRATEELLGGMHEKAADTINQQNEDGISGSPEHEEMDSGEYEEEAET